MPVISREFNFLYNQENKWNGATYYGTPFRNGAHLLVLCYWGCTCAGSEIEPLESGLF